MGKHGLWLVALVAIVAVIMLRKRPADPPIDSTAPIDPTLPQSAGRRPSASTLVGFRGPAPFSADTRGSHYRNQFDALRRN